MIDIKENIEIATLTTLGVGGAARLFVDVSSVEEVVEALGEAKRLGVGVAVLGGGSNTLVPDVGVHGVVMHVSISGIEMVVQGADVLLIVGAGVAWDDVVKYAAQHELWGIENLAAIPGTVGAAPVQNIGAYGKELSEVFEWADVVERKSGNTKRIVRSDAAFGYRESIFKKENAWVVTSVALRLSRVGTPDISYKDIADASKAGEALSTPRDVMNVVRAVRAEKMPSSELGSAGSFFKNPVITQELYTKLHTRFPELTGFPVHTGMKVSLAWILDNVLNLKNISFGAVRLYEKHLLVLVTAHGATEADVNTCADFVGARVYAETGIIVEREVQTLTVR